ncbi:MAG TPA: ABC transporter permease, partial [Methylomirabilota bacterium]|nr:ABC transporter permease [Methylomirabilota bacterium]
MIDEGPHVMTPANAAGMFIRAEHLSPGQRAWRRFTRNKLAVISLCFIAVLVAIVLLAPWLSPYQPNDVSDAQFEKPNAQHWFGTDVNGRDLLARTLAGARVSLLVGAVGTGVSLIIGVLWGSIAGYTGGRTDEFMMRFVDILYALPSIIFVIVLITSLEDIVKKFAGTTAFGVSVRLLFLFVGLGAVSWLTMARIVRGQVLSLRERPFVMASRSLGATHARVIFQHILPNTLGVIIVYLTLTVPSVILYESFLSYLGLGIQPPMASWGSLLAEGARQINPVRIYWWLLVFPCVTLVVTLLALNFIGDG